jgi:hypothetical protein
MDTGVQEVEKTEKEIYENIDILNKTLWDGRVLKPTIQEWLSNFSGKEEQDAALYLLSRCMYFNHANTRYLLKGLFRDKYRTPILKEIRESKNDTMDEVVIEAAFHVRLMKTRFLGVGNSAESGDHMLYFFRQENGLPVSPLFTNIDELLQKNEDIEHVVFIDDLCGSGNQVRYEKKLRECIRTLRAKENCPKISYLMLFGTTLGIQRVRNLTFKETGQKWFDEVEAEMELNETYKCFGDLSRYFNDEEEKAKCKEMCLKYGYAMIDKIADRDFKEPLTGEKRDEYIRSCALGYGDCQLLLSLQHNTPNNTLPIFWFEEEGDEWKPIFKRYNKVYK